MVYWGYFYQKSNTLLFPSYRLLFHIPLVKTMDSGQQVMNLAAMTIIKPQKEYWPSLGSNHRPTAFAPFTILTELCRLSKDPEKDSSGQRQCLLVSPMFNSLSLYLKFSIMTLRTKTFETLCEKDKIL